MSHNGAFHLGLLCLPKYLFAGIQNEKVKQATALLGKQILLLKVKLLLGFVFNVPPTAKVIWRQGHGLKSHLTDW